MRDHAKLLADLAYQHNSEGYYVDAVEGLLHAARVYRIRGMKAEAEVCEQDALGIAHFRSIGGKS